MSHCVFFILFFFFFFLRIIYFVNQIPMVHNPYLRRLILFLDSNSICTRRKFPKADMGICASVASEIHDEAYGQENAVYYTETGNTNGVQVNGSTYSHPGSKGLNQDSAILIQVR